MKQELIWMVLVIVGGLAALFFFSKTVRTMFRETLVHPKETCDIAITGKKVTVVREKTGSEEVKHG